MRPAVVLLLCLLAGVSSSPAQPFRITTWQLHELPQVLGAASPASAPATPGHAAAPEDQRWMPLAESLSTADADVVILYGVPDADSARRIANQMKPRKYAVALHTAFRHNAPKGPILGQPLTLLTRKERLAGKSTEWSQTGRIDLPGGFSFATFRHGPSIVALYVAVLPGSLTNGMGAADGQNLARKRNYAAQYLAHHASWLATTYTNPVVATYLTGDINLTPKNPLPDECAKILEQAGFRALAPGAAQDKAGRSITNRLDLDFVLDPIFTKGVEFVASRQVSRTPPEHPFITCDLTLRSPTSAGLKPPAKSPLKLAVAPVTPASPPPAPRAEGTEAPLPLSLESAPAIPTPAPGPAPTPPPQAAPPPGLAAANPSLSATRAVRPWFWPAVGGGFLLIAGMVVATRLRQRRAHTSLEMPASDSVFLEMHVDPAPASPNGLLGSAMILTPPTTTGNAQDALWRPRTRERSRSRDGQSFPEGSEVNVMPHLQRLMRERVVQWLTRQRTQLIDAQEQGTAQVMELQVRLERIKEHFQKRLVEQQQRIADLDTALRGKERIIKDLLRARPPGAGER